MRIYITGMDGMIGSALADLHTSAGDYVVGCDISDTMPAVSRHDIRNYENLRADIIKQRPDRIYHCAAMLGVKNTEDFPEVCRQINEQGTRNVVEIAREVGAHLVFTSSSEVYGNQSEPLHEDSPLLGSNVYAISKIVGEDACMSARDGIKVTVCRMFNCYGPRQVRQFFIPVAIALAIKDVKLQIFGGLDNVRSYLVSYDAAQYIRECADYDFATGQGDVYNVGHGQTVTLGEAANLILQLTGSMSTIEVMTGDHYADREAARDIANRTADISKLLAISNHSPISFENGIRIMIGMFATTRADWSYKREVI